MKIILYPHGGSGNHGCEAIVRATSEIMNRKFPESPVYLASFNKEQDLKYGVNAIDTYLPIEHMPKYHPINIIGKLTNELFHTFSIRDIVNCRAVIREIERDSVCLSIGGDIYSYNGVIPFQTLAINKYARKKQAITVLWGCSISEDCLNSYILSDLKSYDLIIARESITYNNLINVNTKTKLYPDPAFALNTVMDDLPSGFAEDNTIGINISPLIIGCEKHKGATMRNYQLLIKHIIDTTNMQIALIPHVVWENNDDRKPLRQLYDIFKETGRVLMISDRNAMELKGIIARCRMFIGARTHATIAAYSSCVPTLVVGYSVKAKGIAKDLFNTYDNYVIPVQSLEKEKDLINAFDWLNHEEDKIRNHLHGIIPDYCRRAWDAGNEICKLLRRKNG